MNNEEWLRDGRKIPDEVMGYIRKIAVQAVRECGQGPEVVAQIFNFNPLGSYSPPLAAIKNIFLVDTPSACGGVVH
jgi:hypothetical protein